MDKITIKVLKHSRHQHDLHLSQHDSFYLCNGCGHRGFGPRFSCPHGGCSFDLHEECCGIFTPITVHPFLVGCHFRFSRSTPPKNGTRCNACRRNVKGAYYYCNKSKRNLHLSCSRLPTTTTINGMPMTLRNELWAKCSYPACPRRSSGWSYFSPNDQYSCHVACWLQRERNPAVTRMIQR